MNRSPVETHTIKVVFTEPLLGTVSLNKTVYTDFIASKAPADVDTSDEIASVQEMAEKGTSGFHKLSDGRPAVYDYTWKGYMKETAKLMRDMGNVFPKTKNLTAYRQKIGGSMYVFPREIPIIVSTDPAALAELARIPGVSMPNGSGKLATFTRPLRASTAQGERIALANSEILPIGSSLTFSVELWGDSITVEMLEEWLWFGSRHGFGQWRGGSFGRFTSTMT